MVRHFPVRFQGILLRDTAVERVRKHKVLLVPPAPKRGGFSTRKPDLCVNWFKVRENCTSIGLTTSPWSDGKPLVKTVAGQCPEGTGVSQSTFCLHVTHQEHNYSEPEGRGGSLRARVSLKNCPTLDRLKWMFPERIFLFDINHIW